MKVYVGATEGTAAAAPVEVWTVTDVDAASTVLAEFADGDPTPGPDVDLSGPLTHHYKHSDGFAWGYAGSAPSELARCILIDFLGDSAWCGTCAGSGRSKDGGFCLVCGGEKTSFPPGMYQDFKFEFIVPLPKTSRWVLTGDAIRDWVFAWRT